MGLSNGRGGLRGRSGGGGGGGVQWRTAEEEEDRTLTTTWSDAEIMPGRMLTTSRPNANAGSVRNNMRAERGVWESEDNRDTQEARRGPRRRTAVGDQRLKTDKTL